MTILSIILLLISNAVTFRRDKSILYNRSVIIALFYCFFVNFETYNICFLSEGVGLFGGLFHVTSTTQTFHNFIYLLSIIIIQLTAFYPRKVYIDFFIRPYDEKICKFIQNSPIFLGKTGEQFKIIEYPLILLFIITGGLFLMSSSDVISIFLSIELQSYGLYLLATLYKNSELSTSAGLTYFLLGGLSSSFILLGSSLLYTNSGTTNLDGYYIMTSISNIANIYDGMTFNSYSLTYLDTSFLIMGIGFLFKISAAPFHFWSPDVYDAVPTIVTTFVAIIAKISVLILLLELVHYTSNLFFDYNFNWTHSLLLSCFLSFIVGTVLGLSQPRIKKLFAYSTISHIGFILLAISINTLESIEAFTFYLLQYSLSNLNAFIILISIGFNLFSIIYNNETVYNNDSKQLEKNNSPIQFISELKGYFNINPLLALSLSITLFSFIGIPPLMGFFAKQMVLSSALNNGYIFLCIIAILTSVISASYYLSVIKEIFFEKTNFILNKKIIGKIINLYDKDLIKSTEYHFDMRSITLSSFLTLTISIITLLLLLFMFASQEWLRMTRILSLLLIDS